MTDAPAPQPRDTDAAPQVESIVRAALAERYAAPVVRVVDDGAIVQVLPGEPLDRARAAVTAAGLGDPEALVVPIDFARVPWRVVPGGGLQLWRQHGHDGEAGELVTELLDGDPPVQFVATHEGWQLVRAADGATGWVRQGLLGPAGNDVLLVPAEPRLGDPHSDIDPRALAREALALAGAPYVWGGTSGRGIDCSGLVQRAAWRAGRSWLPRHSTALLRVGVRVAPSAAAAGTLEVGDVLVLKGVGAVGSDPADAPSRAVGPGGPAVHPMHVAIAVAGDEVVHASRRNWVVEREATTSLLERYRVLGVRRFGTTRTAADAADGGSTEAAPIRTGRDEDSPEAPQPAPAVPPAEEPA